MFLQVTLKSEATARGFLSDDKLKELKKHDKNLLGAKEEELLFNKLRSTLTKHGVQNTVVINGWKDNGSNERAMREFDFLIVSEPLKTIIHIEAKRSYSILNQEKGSEQLKKGLDFAMENLPFPKDEGWNYSRVLYFGRGKERKSQDEETMSICPKCQLFFLDFDKNLDEWWNEISQPIDVSMPNVTSTSTYIKICKFLFHQMFQQGQCVTQNDITRHTEETALAIATFENIIFWSNEQYSLMNDAQKTRVIFTSPFGTGKTTLIKAKAKEFLKNNCKVTFVLFEETDTSQETLLKKTYQLEFPEAQFPGASIISVKGSGNIFLSFYVHLFDVVKIILKSKHFENIVWRQT